MRRENIAIKKKMICRNAARKNKMHKTIRDKEIQIKQDNEK
jgi:hypothetical protein